MSRAPGIYLGLSNEEYHADEAVGSSGIKTLIERPYRFWHERNPTPKPPLRTKPNSKNSIAKKFGTAYHTLILEPNLFNYKIKFGIDQSQIPGTLGEGEWLRMKEMQRRLFMRPRRAQLLIEGISEVSFFWNDPETGIACKCRFDKFAPAWVVDLKTTRSVADHALDGEMRKLHWDISGAMYSIGANHLKKMIRDGYQMPPQFSDEFISTFVGFDNQIFAFLVQEKDEPHMVRCKALTPYHAACGRDDFRRGLKVLQSLGGAIEHDDYPDIEDM